MFRLDNLTRVFPNARVRTLVISSAVLLAGLSIPLVLQWMIINVFPATIKFLLNCGFAGLVGFTLAKSAQLFLASIKGIQFKQQALDKFKYYKNLLITKSFDIAISLVGSIVLLTVKTFIFPVIFYLEVSVKALLTLIRDYLAKYNSYLVLATSIGVFVTYKVMILLGIFNAVLGAIIAELVKWSFGLALSISTVMFTSVVGTTVSLMGMALNVAMASAGLVLYILSGLWMHASLSLLINLALVACAIYFGKQAPKVTLEGTIAIIRGYSWGNSLYLFGASMNVRAQAICSAILEFIRDSYNLVRHTFSFLRFSSHVEDQVENDALLPLPTDIARDEVAARGVAPAIRDGELLGQERQPEQRVDVDIYVHAKLEYDALLAKLKAVRAMRRTEAYQEGVREAALEISKNISGFIGFIRNNIYLVAAEVEVKSGDVKRVERVVGAAALRTQ